MKVQSTVILTSTDVQVALTAYILSELNATAKVAVTQVQDDSSTQTVYTIDVTELVLSPMKPSKGARSPLTGVKRTRRTKAEIEAERAAQSTPEPLAQAAEHPLEEVAAEEAFSFA